MELKVIGSSSKGNCYLLHSKVYNETLIIEAGYDYASVVRELNYKADSIVGCLITHRHKDHAKYAESFNKIGIHTLGPSDVFEFGRFSKSFVHAIEARRGYSFGSFDIIPIPVVHDVPCYAYAIIHPDMGKMLFITDTKSFDYNLPIDVQYVLVEANYKDEILIDNIRRGSVPALRRSRLIETHMELETTADIFRTNNLPELRSIVLLHLSDDNSNAREFRDYIQGVSGVPTYIAHTGMNLDVSKDY